MLVFCGPHRKRARRFFRTVGELLEVGGNLVATTIDARVVAEHLMNLGLDLHFGPEKSAEASRAREGRDGRESEAVIRVGNGACQIRFQPDQIRRVFGSSAADNVGEGEESDLFGIEYAFTLVEGSEHERGVGDAVNLPEWLTPIPALAALAEEAGLELEYAHNFHEFYALRRDPAANAAAHAALYNMKVLNRNGSIAPDEWEISRLYVAVKFRKVRESSMELDSDDEEEEDDDDEDDDVAASSSLEFHADAGADSRIYENEEVPDIDPIKKAKLLPMAMMKAKKAIGDEAWKALSSEEKTRLTDQELRRLAASN
jgi:mRNA (guanine-N7-)-methyltransferase